MAIDVTQFHQTFFEESFEGLDSMESGLLHLDVEAPDIEAIHAIFRAAHSIKGGSGTFGFVEVMAFTHLMETLLDDLREGRRTVTQRTVNLLLQSVDCLRDMLVALREGHEVEHQRVAALQHDFERALYGDAGEATDATSTDDAPGLCADTPAAGWHIVFRPHPHMLRSGNDPVRMLRELQSLGDLTVQVDTTALPAFADLDPEECYLSWQLTVRGDIAQEHIQEVFAWVEGDCELHLTPLVEHRVSPLAQDDHSPQPDMASPRPGSSESADAPVGVERRTGQDRRASSGAPEATSIRVGIEKIDALINMVGELVITQAMLSQLGETFDATRLDKLRDGLDQLERNTRELQESVMRIRMVPISFTFNRFPRLVHDLSQQLGKQVELRMSGEQTELDKTVMEKIGDPLVHLVRNAVDHGIEPPAARQAAGKAATGQLHLHAYHQGGNILIEVSDDGAGLQKAKLVQKARERGLLGEEQSLPDDKIHDLIFEPGFSTAAAVSDVSGRGVGMDVVRRNIKELGGHVEVRSQEGQGTTFTIRLPLTLAILDGQLVRVAQEIYVIPLVSIVESLQIEAALLSSVGGQTDLYRFREAYIPILQLHEVFHLDAHLTELAGALLVVLEAGGRRIGLMVDELLGQQQVVIKSLESNFQRVTGVSGATILGDGTVALILDIAGLIDVTRR